MKKVIYTVIMVFLVAFVSTQTSAQKKGNEIVCFKSDMDCGDCEKTITEYVKFEKGVKNLKVDHISNTILIEYKKGKNTDEGFANAIEKKGYKANKITEEQYKEMVAHAKEHGHVHSDEVHKERK